MASVAVVSRPESARPPRDGSGLVEWAERYGIVRIDLKIGDLAGRLRHVSMPVRKLSYALEQGVGFAGSHYGFTGPVGEDMVMVPDPATAWHDPFLDVPSLSFMAQPVRAGNTDRFQRAPRVVAERAEEHMRGLGIASESRWLPEFEFYVVPGGRDLRSVGSAAGLAADGYHATPPRDRHAGFRARAVQLLEGAGIGVKYDHHETGASGQMEIEIDFNGLVQSADAVLLSKYILRNLAAQEGQTAVFLPKPIASASGNGMHVHIQLLDHEEPVFAGDGYAGLSPVALAFIAGILDHLRSLAAFTNPSTNSYRRLVPGMEAPVRASFATADRSACIRIPGYVVDPAERRFEYRPLDATANPYLAFAALLMAGIDGVERELEPELPDEDGAEPAAAPFPRSLGEALDALEHDSDYLRRGDVFPSLLLDEWVKLKRHEARELELQPHPAEFDLYGDL